MYKKGFSVIEIIVAAAIITTTVTIALSTFSSFFVLSQRAVARTQASLLAEETAEAFFILRDMGWDTYIAPLALGTTYYLSWNGTAYSATTTPTITNQTYTQSITLSAVNRDNITANIGSTGSIDDNTRKMSISIGDQTGEILYTEGLLHNMYE